MRVVGALLVAVLALGGMAFADERAKVVHVLGSDILEVRMLDKTHRLEKVRLIGVQAPGLEKQEPYSKEAHQYLRLMAGGELVDLLSDSGTGDRDPDGRLLRYAVLLWGLDVNAALIRTGQARVSPDIPFSRVEVYRKFQEGACRRKAGGWGAPDVGWGECAPAPAGAGAGAENGRPAAGGDPVVFLARGSRRYHSADCPLLKGAGMMIPMAKALARHMRPCKICWPPTPAQGIP